MTFSKISATFSGLENLQYFSMATHDLFRAKEVGHRVGIMRHGRLVTTLGTADISHLDLERTYLDHMRD